MTTVAERAVQVSAQLPSYHEAPAPVRRKVVVVVDACCEIDPSVAESLGILVMPRTVKVDRQTLTLDAELTLHHSCWSQPPRQITPAPYTLGELAQAYTQVLGAHMSVLALHPPGRLDGTVRVALSARSILLAGQQGAREQMPRVAVYELGAIGLSFTFLAEVAARGAAEGMTLQQLLTLLDHAQSAIACYYLTSKVGPVEALRKPVQGKHGGRSGNEQVWELDRFGGGLFACHARSRNLGRDLFGAGGMLAGDEPTTVRSSDQRFLDRINVARGQQQLPPLEAEPGGLTVRRYFPRGCIELALLPEGFDISRIIEVIRRVEQPSSAQTHSLHHRGGIGR